MIPADRIYIATIADGAASLAEKYGVGLELDTFCVAENMDSPSFDGWDARAKALLARGRRAVLHAPFAEMCPAAVDPKVRAVVLARMEQAFSLCLRYGIGRMVVHAGFVPKVYDPGWFVEQSAGFWRGFIQSKPGDFELLLENVLEPDPGLLASLVDAIGDSRVKACLDIGHLHCLSNASPTAWIETLGARIGHVHLHNNHAGRDEHNALTDGGIAVEAALEQLARHAPDATYTLEIQGDAEPSLRWALGPVAPREDAGADDPARCVLRDTFGYDAFRSGQDTLIQAQLAGRDALGIMPTGAGKSLCFQVPALLAQGITLVVSPLISLMKDQVAALLQVGVRAAFLNSSLTERQFASALENARQGVYKLIYVAPERLATPRFLSFARQARISLVAVDEAHCISQWGQDFRPSYLQIPQFISALSTRPAVSAFTATATPQVREDIQRLLALENPVIVQTGFDRPNLFYEVRRASGKQKALLALLSRWRGQSGIIYCATRKNVETICALLLSHGYPATRYHAGLSEAERRSNQEDFSFDRRPMIVATNAFGMGIDKSNVRFVIHYNTPKDLESYYQEAGRAGRDGERADCVLLFSGQDISLQRMLIDHEEPGDTLEPALRKEAQEKAYLRLAEMARYGRTQQCLRAELLRYFGEQAASDCGHCGNCGKETAATDVTEEARLLLRSVKSTGQRFGMGLLIDMLMGRRDQRVLRAGLDKNPLYAAVRGTPRDRLAAICGQLVVEGYLQEKAGRYPILSLSDSGGAALETEDTIRLRLAPDEKRSAPEREDLGHAEKMPALGENLPLFEALRGLRLRLATELGIPAFVVFSDATLRDMSQRQPATREAFLEVKGVGNAKMRQFGDAFLSEIERFAKTPDTSRPY